MRPQDAYEKRAEVRFLDVREPYEFDAGHVPDSLHLPLMQIPDRTGELEESSTWVVVCQIGQRSDMAARFLRVRGYEAHNLDGGIEAWARAGLPIATGRDEQGRIVDGYGRVLEWLPEADGPL